MWRPWFQIHPETVFDHTRQQVTSLSRIPQHIDLFIIGFDDAVWSTWWETAPGWQPWFQVHPEIRFDHATQRVVPLSRTPGHVDLFVIGSDDMVWTTWWEAGPNWQPWFRIHPEIRFDHTRQHIVPLARTPGHVDLFVIGSDNMVWSTWWEAGPNWQPWFRIHPETVFDHTTQRVFALSRNPNHVDLFVIGFDNVIWSTWWEAGPGWQPWFRIHPETVFDHTTQRVVALSRNPDHVDLFVIGFDNVVWSTWWEMAPGWQPWYQVHPETVFDHTAQLISPLSRDPDHVDLFVVGFDNAVWSADWQPDPGGTAQLSADGSTVTFDSGPVTSSQPLGGSVRVVMDRNGSFTFTCHAHDSGFDNIDYAMGAVVLAANGIAFTFSHSGHTEGTSAGLPFGTPDRDDSFTAGGANAQITTEWAQLVNGRLFASLAGQDTLVNGIEGMLSTLVNAALQQAGKAAAVAVIALL